MKPLRVKLKTTKEKIELIEKECSRRVINNMFCSNNPENRITCDICPISDKFERFVGIRLEEVERTK